MSEHTVVPTKVFNQMDGENKISHDKIKFKHYLSTNLGTQKKLEGKSNPRRLTTPKKTKEIISQQQNQNQENTYTHMRAHTHTHTHTHACVHAHAHTQ